MAKFCGNCGTQLDDSAKVCGNCGTPLATNSGNTSSLEPKFTYVDPEKKARKRKKTIIAITCAVIVVVAIITWNIISGFIGYKGAVRKVMNAYEDYDIETIVNISSDYYFFMESDDYAEEYFKEVVSSDLDNYEAQAGHDYSLSYDISESYSMSKHKYEALLDTLSYGSDFDADIISEVMVVEVAVTVEGEGSMTTTIELTLTKEDGEWRLLYIN